MVASLAEKGSKTSTILGSVAVGVAGVGAIAAAVIYLRRGGTVGGLFQAVKSQRGNIKRLANALPISEEQKAKLGRAIDAPTTALPTQVTEVLEKGEALRERAIAANQSVIQMLPPSVGSVVAAKQTEIAQHVQEKVKHTVAAVEETTFIAKPTSVPTPTIVLEEGATPSTAKVAEEIVHMAVRPEDIEAVRAFLAGKKTEQ
jgi:hypothetical protein